MFHRRVQPQVHRPPRVGHATDVSPRLDREKNRDDMFYSIYMIIVLEYIQITREPQHNHMQ